MSSDSRLERAMEAFLDCQERGVPRHQALASHPDLAELLGMLFDGENAADTGEADTGEAKVFGDFRILREIGRGGMGVVFEAFQRSLGRRIALKVLGNGVATSPTQVARFRREALTLARLDHPHIVRILDVGETDGQHWLAMELVDGQSLEQHLAELRQAGGHRGASLRDVVEVIAAIASALQHVHDAGILHRDVKPSNVLLRRDGHALLSDFGLARDDAAPTMTQAGVIAGTPHYMSPEHLAGGSALSPASDVFSLGAALYECITLQRPFAGGTNEVVLRQILLHDPPDPRRLHKGLHADLAAIACKAIEKDPARRYATAADFADDLRAFLELRPVQARTPSSLQRLRRWARREPWRAALGAVLLVCTAMAGYMAVQLPELRAASSARADREFEQAVSLGWMQRTSNRRDECLAAFRRALAVRPQSTEAIAGLCMAIRHFEGAEPAFAELDRRSPEADDPELLQRARMLMLQVLGRTAEVAAIGKDLPPPRTATGLWFTGTVTLSMAGTDPVARRAALEQLSLAVRLAPMPRLTLVLQWVIAAYVAEDPTALRECHQTLLQLWPEHPFALHHAALALTWSDPARAIELCRLARALGMPPAESHWLEVALLDRTDRKAELVAAVRQALTFPWDDRRHAILIDLLATNGDAEGEVTAVEAWFKTAPDNLEAMSRMAMLSSRRGNHAGAIDLFAAVAAQRPADGEAHYNLAKARHAAGLDEQVRATLATALERAPDHEAAHRLLLGLLTADHDAAGILTELRRWAEALPQDPAAHLALAQALVAHGPAAAAEAMIAVGAADYLAAGKDPAILDCKAAVHDALGETGPASRCRAAAAAMRDQAKAVPQPSAK